MKNRRKIWKQILSAGLCTTVVVSGFSPFTVKADSVKTYTIDLSQTDGEMLTKTGWLLTPNESLPDGRIIPLNTRMVRDDWESQNIWGHHAGAEVPNSPLRTPDTELNEHNRFERMKDGIDRLTDLGIEYYPITSYNTSWIGADGSIDMEDVPAFRQYVKDMAQYFEDHDVPVDEINVWNEYATGVSKDEFNKMYEECWYATRSINPDIRLIGPSSTGYQDNYGSVKYLTDYCEKKGITLDKAAWHFGDTSTVAEFQKSLADYISKKPSVGQPDYYYEEYNGYVQSAFDEMVAISNIDRSDIDVAIRGIWLWANGLSDMVEINFTDKENPYKRNLMWWVTTAYGNMTGTRIQHTGTGREPYVCSYDEEKGEIKLLLAYDQTGDVELEFTNSPFEGSDIQIDKYKISKEIVAATENDGIQFQSEEGVASSGDTISTSVSFGSDPKQEAWLVVLKKADSIPSDFSLLTPDDGMAAGTAPTFTWQKSQGAESYTLTIAEDKKFSNVVYEKDGITEESFTLDEALEEGKDYYWTVTAKNGAGEREPLNGMYYSLTAADHAVPAIFTITQPVQEDGFVPLNTHFAWTPSIDATGYKIYISKTADFSDPIVISVDDEQYLNDHYLAQNQERKTYNYYLTDDQKLEPNTRYYAYMSATNEAGERVMAGEAHEFTTTTADGKPAEFKITLPADKATVNPRFTLRWETSTAAQFYQLEIAEDPEFENVVFKEDKVSVPAYTVEANTLKPETTYYWRVTATDWAYDPATRTSGVTQTIPNANGVQSFTTSEKPAAPLLKTAMPVNKGAVLTFEAIEEADSYVVKYGTEPGTYTMQAETAEESVFIPLEEGVTYYWSVAAVRNGVEGDTWGELTAVAGSGTLDVVLDKTLEAELFPNQKNVTFSTAEGPSGGLAVKFDGTGAEIGLTAAEESQTVALQYQTAQDTVVGLYKGDEKLQDVKLYQTEEGTWNKITVEASFAAGDSLRLVKETKGAAFVVDYIVLSNKEPQVYANLALKKPAKANSTGMGYTADKAVDGSRSASSWWRSGSAATADSPNWLTIDLEGEAEIHSFEIALPDSPNWGPRTEEFRILTSMDGEDYTEAVAKTAYKFDMDANNNKVEIALENPIEASYVKVEGYSNDGDADYTQIGELYVYGSMQESVEGKNLALKKPATMYHQAHNGPAVITDGDVSSFIDGGGDCFPNYVTVDLEGMYHLSKIEIALPTNWGARNQEMEIQTSADGKEFTTVVEKTKYNFDKNKNGNQATIELDADVVGRYVRVVGYSNDEVDKPGIQISELRVFGSCTPVVSIAIDQEDMQLAVKDSVQLTATLEPKEAENRSIAWSSSDITVASVDKNGVVTGLTPGEAVICARSIDGKFEDTCKITVVEKEPVAELPYEDVAEEDWYYDAVHYNYFAKTMTGLSEKEFGPGKALVRADFAVVLHRMDGTPEVTYKPVFPDVEEGEWYTDAVLWANREGIINGYADNKTFGPADNITREQIAVMLYRYAEYKEYDVSKKADFSGFTDGENVSEFAKEAMEWAVGTGIISGKDNGTVLEPQGNANRAECAAIIMRFMEAYK